MNVQEQNLIQQLERYYPDDRNSVQRNLAKILNLSVEGVRDLYPIQEALTDGAASATATPLGDSTPIISSEGFLDKLYLPSVMREQTVLDNGQPQFAQYIYTGNEPLHADICARFDKKIFDLDDTIHRPVPPSEGLGYTNTHPNCKCYWRYISGAQFDQTPDTPSETDQKTMTNIHKKIAKRAKSGKLHTVFPDGSLSQRMRSSNPRNVAWTVMREALVGIREEFSWLTPKYEMAIHDLPVDGKWYIIRASTQTVTDHRSEGEPYRRLLSGDELHALTRTAIGKEMDVNHNPKFKTQAHIYDAEYDREKEQSQMLVLESDPEIIQAIDNGVITAVSINGGSPRSERIECTPEECFVVPEGVVLGELDNVALTWVVTDPRGFFYKGELLPAAMPGVRNTVIEEF